MTDAQHARWLEGQVLAISISKTTRLVYGPSWACRGSIRVFANSYTVETQTIRGGSLVWRQLYNGADRERMIRLMEDYVR